MVSVIVPVYNAEKYIKRCVDSILGQTIRDLEIIMVNDGSTDRSSELLQEYANQDGRIAVLSQENKGVAAARNTGLQRAKGDYLLYVDADDWLENNAIACLLERMHEKSDIVYCSFDHAETPEEVRYEKEEELEEWDHERQIYEFIRHQHMSGMLWNKLIRRSLTEGVSFNEKTGYGEDAEFLWHVLQRSRCMVVTNRILYHHVLEKTSISHLSYSEKKYSAIPMWEGINADVERKYPKYLEQARVSLASAAVFGTYEARKSGYQNRTQLRHMRAIVKKNIMPLLCADYLSLKMKAYALSMCI